MSDVLTKMRDVIQVDAAQRGLAKDPKSNLINALPNDFAASCHSLAETSNAAVAIFTGFLLPNVARPCAETDGPLGALFLARALTPLGVRVALVTDWFCQRALQVGLSAAGLDDAVAVQSLPPPSPAWTTFVPDNWLDFASGFGLTHMISVEWIGPSHTLETIQAQLGPQRGMGDAYVNFTREVPTDEQNRCHTMKGLDITETTSPAHRLFELTKQAMPKVTTLGIGDGGNEIGMGKIPWDVIRRNIPNGGRIACRVPTDHLIVAGVSNWGAYGLAAGVRSLRKSWPAPDLMDPRAEIRLLKTMVTEGPLVDGVTGKPTLTVDGLAWDKYSSALKQLGTIN